MLIKFFVVWKAEAKKHLPIEILDKSIEINNLKIVCQKYLLVIASERVSVALIGSKKSNKIIAKKLFVN